MRLSQKPQNGHLLASYIDTESVRQTEATNKNIGAFLNNSQSWTMADG